MSLMFDFPEERDDRTESHLKSGFQNEERRLVTLPECVTLDT